MLNLLSLVRANLTNKQLLGFIVLMLMPGGSFVLIAILYRKYRDRIERFFRLKK